ncbi:MULTISPECIES: hypothetical protein [Pantoea]|jgi:hypothetical protein|uniref:Uncharacterized protein n=1 Tax=Pantoea brenneri TaxID=472694 RepID=A0A7Y6TTL3_9GAMM|nr:MULTISPECIES: hypothetical protein [Pantoea]MBZ6397037.1 hypothetical protein [Pantoea sp.]MBZ6440212.1 hypothetical protein [Pantoea sp.]NUY43426.1 hypothetical protein [Pantoea brenneri]NUY51008.1 hypothetical protein [Pantoea brenneri]NUY61261.1 hypothetical protein [Pantoea brenneri]
MGRPKNCDNCDRTRQRLTQQNKENMEILTAHYQGRIVSLERQIAELQKELARRPIPKG